MLDSTTGFDPQVPHEDASVVLEVSWTGFVVADPQADHWLDSLVEGLTEVARVVLDQPNQLLWATGVVLAFGVSDLELEPTHEPQLL